MLRIDLRLGGKNMAAGRSVKYMVGIVVILAVVLVGLVLLKSKPAGNVRIGFMGPLTGEVGSIGMRMKNAAALAVDEANAAGGVAGRKLELVSRDDLMDPKTATAALYGMIDADRISCVLGTGMSAIVTAEASVAGEKKIPLVTSSATAIALTGMNPYIFRVIPSNYFQAASLAKVAWQKYNFKRVAILFMQDDYSKDLKDAFTKEYTALGGVVTEAKGFEPTDTDFRMQLTALAGTRPDALFIPAQHVATARLLLRAREMGLRFPFLAGETAFTEEVLKNAGRAAEGLVVSGSALDVSNPGASLKKFMDDFKKKYGEDPDAYAAYTYDATLALIAALKATKCAAGVKLRDALAKVGGVDGATGTIAFGQNREVPKEYQILEVKAGKFVPVQ
jgi:branched-chain amino acid transport system substrate-binding protein